MSYLHKMQMHTENYIHAFLEYLRWICNYSIALLEHITSTKILLNFHRAKNKQNIHYA